ncbi:MAG: ABC transporter substrate-binding protein [Syntrophobacteraceae bacterium]
MRFNQFQGSRTAFRAAAAAITWLVLISVLHAYLNADRKSGQKIAMGYMPVITNLAAPLIDLASKDQDVQFQATKFASFAEMSEAFRSGHLQVAFIIAPLAVVMHQQGVPLKVVYIGNRHESTLVADKNLPTNDLSGLAGKTIAVPIRYSGHMLALKRYVREHGLGEDAIRIVEIPPPDMPAAMATGGVDGFFVGEPFASKALRDGIAKRVANVEQLWPGFICNLMIVRQELIESKPQIVRQLVAAAVKSGIWAEGHVDEAVRILAGYWGQDPEFVRYVFNNPPGRFRFDLYRPEVREMEEIVLEMRHSGLLTGSVDISALVEDRFVKSVSTTAISSIEDILKN